LSILARGEQATAEKPIPVARVTGGEDEPDPYLMDVFEAVQDEPPLDDLEAVDEIPTDLDGVFPRNGPHLPGHRFDEADSASRKEGRELWEIGIAIPCRPRVVTGQAASSSEPSFSPG
jgi:hypothetical protein